MSKTSKIRKLKAQLEYQERLVIAKGDVIDSAKREILRLTRKQRVLEEKWGCIVDIFAHTLGRDHVIKQLISGQVRSVPLFGDIYKRPRPQQLSFSPSEMVFTEPELELVCPYALHRLVIQYVRSGGGDMLKVDISDSHGQCYISPMLLQAKDRKFAVNLLAEEFLTVLERGAKPHGSNTYQR